MPLYLENFGYIADTTLTLNNGATIINGDESTLTITETNINLNGHTTITGNTTINGDLTVIGTTTTVNSSTLVLQDPVIDLGKGSTDARDALSRGMRFSYGTGTGEGTDYNYGFLGWDGRSSSDDTTGELVFYTTGATAANGNYSGATLGSAKFGGLTVGSGTDTGIITSNGQHDLKLQTGNNDGGSITIGQAANSNIYITPNGTGKVIIGGGGTGGVESNSDDGISTSTIIDSALTAVSTFKDLFDTSGDVVGSAGSAVVDFFTGAVTAVGGGAIAGVAGVAAAITTVSLSQIETRNDNNELTGFSGAHMDVSKDFTITTAGYLNLNAVSAVNMSNPKLLVSGTNIRDSMEHVEIVPCDASVFGSTMGPIVMDTATYNGWNLSNSVQSGGLASWTITLPSQIVFSQIQYITVDIKQNASANNPLKLKVSADGSNYNTYDFDSGSKSVGTYQNFARLTGTGTPKGRLGHTALATGTGTTEGTVSSSSNIASITLNNAATDNLDVIINSISIITSEDYGTLTYKFSNDSVRQAQSAYAVSALYAILYNKSVDMSTVDILAANAISGAGYNGIIDSNVYGGANVLANYTISVLIYGSSSYSGDTGTQLTAINKSVDSTVPTGATYTISPTLPTGLTLDANTGSITGTPTQVTTATSYVVTASKTGSTTTATFTLTTPLGINYNETYIFTSYDVSIPSPGVDGVTYAISPTLPTGLTLDANTGAISGTVNTALTSTNYSVTATHAVTNTTATDSFSIETSSFNVTYAPALATVAPASTVSFNAPTLTDAESATYTISPAGLTLDANTGAISGTTDGIIGTVTYTVTATSGENTATTQVTVVQQ